MTIYNDLIDLFATHAVSEIQGNNGQIQTKRFGAATVEELVAKIEGYKDNFILIRECKAELENILARNVTSAARQVTECLESVHKDKEDNRPRRGKAFYDLVKGSVYATAWTTQERNTFDDKYEVIMDWRDYFLSYTNRDALVTNNTFRKLIEFASFPKVTEWHKKNFLAPIVVKILRRNGAIGFFDQYDIKSGDEIEDDIRKFCRQCLAFVQIVEPETFATPPAGELNWCFEEYNEFDSAVSRLHALDGHVPATRYHFVITAEPIQKLKPVKLDPNYDAWFTHAKRLHRKSLQNKEYWEVDEAVVEIASEVDKLRKSVIAELLQ